MTPPVASLAWATALFVLVPTVAAQTPSALLREGDLVPAGQPGQLVTSFSATAVNQTGGYSARANTTAGVGSTAHVVGSAAAGPIATLRSNQAGLAGYDQTAFEAFFGMDDAGQLGYGPTCTEISSGTTGLDCAWLDATPIAVEGQAIGTLPGKKFRFNSRIGMTGNGTIYWVGGINDIATNADEGNGLFAGAGQTVILKTGDPSPPPLVSTLGASAADFDVRYSANGTNWILVIDTTDATSADAHLVSNGAILLDAGGNRISEGTLVSPAAGGNGTELWGNFGSLGINEAGDFMFDGDTNAATAADGFLAKNGTILWREGQVVDGLTLTGNGISAGSYMNEQGDIAMVWDTTGSVGALFLNGEVLLKEGDMVDWDGDGNLDANTAVTSFTGIASLTLGPRTASGTEVYFTADVNVGGPVLQGYFRIHVPPDITAFCFGDGTQATPCPCANDGLAGHGCDNSAATGGALLVASGTTSPDAVVLTSSGERPTAISVFLQGDVDRPVPVVFGDGVRCVGGNLLRLYVKRAVGGVVSAPEAGEPSITTRSASLGDPIAPGTGRSYQVYYRDPVLAFCPDPPGNAANVSNGIRVQW